MSENFDFGLLINQLMRVHNVSIEELANRIDYTPQGLGKVLKKKDLNTDVLRKIAQALNVDIVELLAAPRGISQVGNANVAGEGNIRYKGGNISTQSDDKSKIAMLESEIVYLKEQNHLLREMIELLKPKNQP